MNINTKWKCPYCGFVNTYVYDTQAGVYEDIAWCDVDKGGCDCRVVLDFKLTVSVVVNTVNDVSGVAA